MKRIHIPGSDLWVFPFAFGTGSLNRQNEQRQQTILDQYLAAGGNLIDTAANYGRENDCYANLTEQAVGAFLKSRKCSPDILISTKGGHPLIADMTQSRLTERQVRCDLELSRKALHRSRIDLYFLHRDNPDLPIECLVDLLERFVSEGLINRYGLSNFQTDRVAAACAYCQRKGYKGLAAVSNRWSLSRFNPDGTDDKTLAAMDDRLYDLHLRQPIAAMPYSGQGKGYFAKRAENPDQVPKKLKRYYDNELNDHRLQALLTISRERQIPVAVLSLAFMLQQPFPVIPVLSFSSLAQLQEAILATEIHLRSAEMIFLSAGERF